MTPLLFSELWVLSGWVGGIVVWFVLPEWEKPPEVSLAYLLLMVCFFTVFAPLAWLYLIGHGVFLVFVHLDTIVIYQRGKQK